MKLGELLVQKRVISQEQLNDILAVQSFSQQKLGELLLESSLISTETLDTTLKEQYWRNNGFWVIG